jgi:hypothetical protein
MGIRLGATMVVVASALCATASACGRATAATASCVPASAHRHVFASNGHAAVYTAHGAYYACDVATGTRIKLGSATLCIGSARFDHAALAGDLVAYGIERCGVDTGTASVLVRRLSDGERLKSFPAITIGTLPESYQSVSSIVIRRDGAVAWISGAHSIIGRGTRVAVYGNGRLLDSGLAIGPASLRLNGTTLSWKHGSETRTATLS